MTLITRQGKGSRISTQEMDDNMDYLEQNSIINITGITSQIGPFDEDKINYINKIEVTENKTVYKGVLYGEHESPMSEIILKYNDSVNNQSDIDFEYGDSYFLSGDLIYKRNEEYEIVKFETGLRYNPSTSGTFDGSFNIGNGLNGRVNAIQVQSDGKVLVGGEFTQYSGVFHNRIMRLNFDGSTDSSFWFGDGFNNSVISIQIQSDGKLLMGGDFSSYDNVSRNRITRLNSNGSIDNTFNIGTGFNGRVETIQIQSDGKILVGGTFSSYNGTTSNKIIRLNSDGSVDNTFNIGTGFNSDVISIQIQSDTKILVGGEFTEYNGTTSNKIIRLNSDGGIDNTFNVGTGFNDDVETIQIQSDGKILVGGLFTEYNGTTSNGLIRLNSDGSVDDTLYIGTGFDGSVLTIQIQSDGKILVGGGFQGYSGTTSNHITRLNSDGSIDDTFGGGCDSDVYVILLKSDVTLFVGGDFSNNFGKMSADYQGERWTLLSSFFGDSLSYSVLDVNSEGKLTLLLRINTEKFILDFNLTQIKN